MKKLDPELLRQLDDADAGGNGTVQAVFTIVDPDFRPLPRPEEIHTAVARLLAETTRRTQERPAHHRVFAHLGAFAVEARPQFLRDLMRQDDVLSAVANSRSSLFTRGA